MTTKVNTNQINADSRGGSYVLTTSDRKTKNLFFLSVLGLVVIASLIGAFLRTLDSLISSEVQLSAQCCISHSKFVVVI